MNEVDFDYVEALEYGMVSLNTPKMTGQQIPGSGYKQSGLGREGSRFGLDEFSQLKYFCWSQD
ncbi:MAG: aldehyde dehydrogenase family protein [Bacteroidetes bacterium]|nr:aldehyde dehydrogenase family protein [Bacteroidota bacterium]